MLERIVVQSDGVPLFIEELTKAVVENTEQSGSNAAPLEVPATLQASLIARLDRLPAAKQIAQVGAVIGREFAHPLLAAIADMPETQLAQGIRCWFHRVWRSSTGCHRAPPTPSNMRWFEMVGLRGHIDEGKVAYYQVTLKVGFTLE